MKKFLEQIKFDQAGLVPAIVQDYETNEVLMLAYMNKESLKKTVQTNIAHYFSRSRNQLWKKGETSGNVQHVKSISFDCDADAILLKVDQVCASCHTGHKSCFYREFDGNEINEIGEILFDPQKVYNSKSSIMQDVYNTVLDRVKNPKEKSYTNYLLDKGIDKILKKVGEEASEVIIASKNNSKDEIRYEVADLFYHVIVLLVERGLTLEDIYGELKERENK